MTATMVIAGSKKQSSTAASLRLDDICVKGFQSLGISVAQPLYDYLDRLAAELDKGELKAESPTGKDEWKDLIKSLGDELGVTTGFGSGHLGKLQSYLERALGVEQSMGLNYNYFSAKGMISEAALKDIKGFVKVSEQLRTHLEHSGNPGVVCLEDFADLIEKFLKSHPNVPASRLPVLTGHCSGSVRRLQ